MSQYAIYDGASCLSSSQSFKGSIHRLARAADLPREALAKDVAFGHDQDHSEAFLDEASNWTVVEGRGVKAFTPQRSDQSIRSVASLQASPSGGCFNGGLNTQIPIHDLHKAWLLLKLTITQNLLHLNVKASVTQGSWRSWSHATSLEWQKLGINSVNYFGSSQSYRPIHCFVTLFFGGHNGLPISTFVTGPGPCPSGASWRSRSHVPPTSHHVTANAHPPNHRRDPLKLICPDRPSTTTFHSPSPNLSPTMSYGKKDEDAELGLVKVDRTQVFQEGERAIGIPSSPSSWGP